MSTLSGNITLTLTDEQVQQLRGRSVALGNITLTSTTTATLLSGLAGMPAGGIPAGATRFEFTASAQVTYSDDGTTVPDADGPVVVPAGVPWRIDTDLADVKFFGDATLSGGFYS